MTRWASGRLPRWARHAVDTDDLVQETLIQVCQKLEGFEYRGEGALLAYLRQAVLNRVRNQLRWAERRPRARELDDGLEAAGASPLEAAIGAEALERYETALARLASHEREAVIARLELGLTYPELALDRELVVTTATRDFEQCWVRLVDAHGTDQVRHRFPGECQAVVWTRDGDRLLVATFPVSRSEFWLLARAGGDPVKLSLDAEGIWDLSLGPDGRELLYSTGNPRPNMVVLRGLSGAR